MALNAPKPNSGIKILAARGSQIQDWTAWNKYGLASLTHAGHVLMFISTAMLSTTHAVNLFTVVEAPESIGSQCESK